VPAERLAGRRLVLVTGHRRESFGDGMRNICLALRTLAERHGDALIVYPVHLNPAVQAPVREILSDQANVVLTPPLDYLPFVDLMRRAYLILTDSGGVQEEAPSLGVPVLVMRETTERPEAVAAGTAKLVGTRRDVIVDAASLLLNDADAHARMRSAKNPFGDGTAAKRIAQHLAAALA
jgi:UDP-N-acetylglucosamine 2-epimerase (non-hydrolysing)